MLPCLISARTASYAVVVVEAPATCLTKTCSCVDAGVTGAIKVKAGQGEFLLPPDNSTSS